MKSKRAVLTALLGVFVLVGVGIQLVPVDRSNPPVTMEVPAPDHVREILRTSCYDCHSNETVWPWYSYVAPISWQVAEDVEHGRREMNFSEWDKYDAGERAHLIGECVEEVEEGEMPLKIYLRAHPEAELSAEQIEALRTWAALAGMGGGGQDEPGGAGYEEGGEHEGDGDE